MERLGKIAALICGMLILTGHTVCRAGDTLQFEVLFSKKMAEAIGFQEKLINELEVTPNGLLLLSSATQNYLLGWGGMTLYGQQQSGRIVSYTYLKDKFLFTIKDKAICASDSSGKLNPVIKLPNEEMGISAGKHVLYVYDKKESPAKHALYSIRKGKKYKKLIEVPSSISDVVEVGDSILFTSQNAIFSYNLTTKKLRTVAAIEKQNKIISLCANQSGDKLFFSDGKSIYTLMNKKAGIVTSQYGGILKYYKEGLMVFDADKMMIIRVAGLENFIKKSKTVAIKKK